MGRFRLGLLLLMLASGLVACGETPRPTPNYAIPTPPPTPLNYNGVPDAATAGPFARPTPFQPSGAVAAPLATLLPLDVTPTIPGDLSMNDGSTDNGDSGGPGERLIDGTDPSVLARLYGTPGPGSVSTGLPPKVGNNAQPNNPQPTPTLSTNPNAVRIISLKTTQLSFIYCYKQASVKVLEVSRNAKLAFASANNLKTDRTTWTFLFVSADGSHMWRVIFDSQDNRLDLREVAPSMLGDANLIDMSKVMDTPALVDQAAAAGLNTNLPVDIVNFQIEGQTKQPSFIFTNVAQGKQVAIQAYTGQIIRNDFSY